MIWSYTPVDEGKVKSLSKNLGLSEITASLLARLPLKDDEECRKFLEPRLQNLDDPFRLANMDKAVTRLQLAMMRDESILVFGDYDVDGVTSTVFLVSILHSFGLFPRFLVPRRLDEGYGLSRTAIDRALEEGVPQLLIAVDCGTNSREEVAYLRTQGVDVIILDHHTSKEGLPEDCILVNPHVHDSVDEPWHDLCSVGLIFKFVHGLIKRLRDEGDDLALQIELKDYLDLTAMGTVADLVPLLHENRILAKIGLQRLKNTRRPGLSTLFEVSGMSLGDTVTPFDIGFRLGPRINASGRLADASLPINLLLSEDRRDSLEAARTLDEFNRERQEIERKIVIAAESMVEEQFLKDSGLVLYDSDWHSGVVGIVASRLSFKYYRPAIVLGAEGDMAKGSGRSIANINLVEVLQGCAHLLDHWGGHPMAVGVSLEPQKLEEFRNAFCKAILEAADGQMPQPELEIFRWISVTEINDIFLDELERLHPFGQGNPEPVFGIENTMLTQPPKTFGRGHFRFQLETGAGRPISGVAWKQANNLPPVGEPIDIAVKVSWNYWNNRQFPQIQLVDWRHYQGVSG